MEQGVYGQGFPTNRPVTYWFEEEDLNNCRLYSTIRQQHTLNPWDRNTLAATLAKP
jgi:hypothetical protein